MNHRNAGAGFPAQPFFTTPQQRLALARQRYFDEGVRPSGLIGENVIQSWSRCVQEHRDPVEHIAFNPVTPSRVHSSLARSQVLLDAAATDLTQLETTLAGTGCTAILTDPLGVVVHATRLAGDHDGTLLPLVRRVGVSLDEAHIGTGAPGVTLRTGQACRILGAEHFFSHMQVLHCAAAPIHDIHGRLAAVLDLSTESRPFGFDAAAVVAICATTIENRLLQAQSVEHVVIHLQTSPALLGTPMEGLAGLDSQGRVAWVNSVGSRLLGVATDELGLDAEQVFGLDASRLAGLTHASGASMHRLPNGLSVWLVARMHARDGAAGALRVDTAAALAPFPPAGDAAADATVPAEPAAAESSLRDNDRNLIARTVQACGGNVSMAARRLGVSRGRVYRHLKQIRTG